MLIERNVQMDSEFQVLADVPGAQKEAIHLDIDKNTLTISVAQPGATQAATEPEAATHHTTTDEPAQTAAEADKTQQATVPAAQAKAEEPKVLHRERADGFAKRSVKLPETADLEQARAECADGILKVTFSKKTLPGPKRISIV